jgi:GDP-4-dehydro-6-deoxy-D-mannose reductase
MRALVTGASGFVGGYLVEHLRSSGDEVAPIGDEVDITVAAEIARAIAGARPEAIFHLAARSHVGESWSDVGGLMRVNVEGTANVLEAARVNGVERVLVVGSAEEYGRASSAEIPLTEDAPLRPVTPYGASKVAASFLALQAALATGMHTIRVRAFPHTGPGQNGRFLVPALARRIATAEAETGGTGRVAVGNLDPVRDITDVRDVVRAYRLLVERGAAGEVYNVARGEGFRVADIAGRLIAGARRPLELAHDPELARPVDVPVLVGDSSKLRAATGWEPQYSLDDTLADVLEHARANAHNS